VRFDVVQQHDDPTRFVLVEVYRAVEDQARHRLTDHYGGGGHDGRAAVHLEIHQRLPRRGRLVMRFEFATAQRIIFGMGVLAEAGPLAKGLGRRPLVVTGRDGSLYEKTNSEGGLGPFFLALGSVPSQASGSVRSM
jgi:hypothetical protein